MSNKILGCEDKSGKGKHDYLKLYLHDECSRIDIILSSVKEFEMIFPFLKRLISNNFALVNLLFISYEFFVLYIHFSETWRHYRSSR
jgi:hypothetical protein